MNELLNEKTILITGAARRFGRLFALASARAGADVVIHHAHLEAEADSLREEIIGLGCKVWIFNTDLSDSSQAERLIPLINESTPLFALVNSAAIFKSLSLEATSLEDWQQHLQINLTAPFLLRQTIVDWRALRSSADHLPYTISKAALALGTILPPSDGNKNQDIIKNVPLKHWANENEVEEVLLFLLSCPAYIAGEIMPVDSGRHLI